MNTTIFTEDERLIVFDVATSVIRNIPSKVTQHPIEDGSNITDHVIQEPKTISIVAKISDASFTFLEDDIFTETRRLEVGQTAGVRRVAQEGRSQLALEALEAIRDEAQVFTLSTRDQVFPNCVFTSFSIPRDKDTGQASIMEFTVQEVETVDRDSTVIPQAVAADSEDNASGVAETGRQQQEPLDSEGARSVLVELFEEISSSDINISDLISDTIPTGGS